MDNFKENETSSNYNPIKKEKFHFDQIFNPNIKI
jgi:hypothetical protein